MKAEKLLKFVEDMIAAIELEQETPERLQERSDLIDLRDELFQEIHQ